jgi:futalosine hydrolase
MNMLLVLATHKEASILRTMLEKYSAGENHYRFKEYSIDLAVTGSGIVQTTYYVTEALSSTKYDLAINLGICGSFKNEYKIGDVVHIHKDRFSDWGVVEKDGFKDVFDMKLEEENKRPFEEGWIFEHLSAATKHHLQIPTVEGLTVNTIKAKEFDWYHNRYDADIESMEGAAFLYACRMKGVHCTQLRAVSNSVGERDKSKWGIVSALKNLSEYFSDDFLMRL